MIAPTLLWLAFVAATGVVAYFGPRRQALAFVAIVGATLPLSFATLGRPAVWQPAQGQHVVLGARIDKDVAIYVLLNADGEPRYYRLPYSEGSAGELQEAMDGTADGDGTIVMEFGGNSASFREESGPPEPPKAAPQPALVSP